MTKSYLRKLLAASILTLLPIGIGLVLWNRLPDVMATHWGVSGAADGVASKATVVFLFPLIMVAFLWLCGFLSEQDSKNKEQNNKAKGIAIWLIPMISCLMSGVMYAAAMGIALNVSVLLGIVMGSMFIVIGNYLPKCKQNFTMGIKITPTLESEENWNATHRLAGKVWFVGGFAMFVFMFLPDMWAVTLMMVWVFVMMIIPTAYSYAYRRKQLASHEHDIKPYELQSSFKIVRNVALITIPLILIGCTVLMFTGSVDITLQESDFSVHATYWSDIHVPYDDIVRVEYCEDFRGATRLYGFESATLSLGVYENEDMGMFTRYTYRTCNAAIVLYGEDRVLVLSGKSDEDTARLYEQFKEALA